MIKPAGLDELIWSAALAAFRDAIGEEWVFISPEDTALYRDAYSPYWGEPEEILISAALAPANTAQVQAIVRIANQFSVPLYPVSTGKNLGYGGAAPNSIGDVVVDLKRMNRIIEVDDKRHYAIVEPGVSYFDLYNHIRSRGLNLMVDCPDTGWGSVIGNALDHGVGHTWGSYRDHFLSHCGMEVVLPDGELMRTGMGAMPGSKTFADFRYGYGPYVDGLFAQAGFGIVTQMGIHMMPQPEGWLQKRILVRRRHDLIPLVEITNHLENSGIVGEVIFESELFYRQPTDPALQRIARSADVWNGDAINAFAQKNDIAVWQVTLNFYGPEEVMEAQWRYAWNEVRKAIPDARQINGERAKFPLTTDQSASVMNKSLIGIPNLGAFSITAKNAFNPVGADGHLFISPILPRDGAEVLKAQQIFTEGLREIGADEMPIFGPFAQPFAFHPRAFLLAGFIPTSRSDPEVNRRAREVMRFLIQIAAENGYGEYRASPFFQDQVMSAYSFNDNAYRSFCETLKDAVDPKGIIAPGRGGIWPSSRRRDGAQ